MNAPRTNTVSIVIPFYNEELNAPLMLDAVSAAMTESKWPWEMIAVDDGSSDDTVNRLLAGAEKHGAHVRVVELSRNFGQTAAMQAGIVAARGDVIVTLDGDLQNDPRDIPMMVGKLLDEKLDLVAGWRKDRQDKLMSRRLPSVIANRLIGRVTKVKIHDYGCSLKAFRASVLKQVRLYGEMHRFIPAWLVTVSSPRRIAEVAVRHHARQHGVSKYGISRTIRVVLDLLVVYFFLRFKARPGHFFGVIGLLLGALGMAGLGWLAVVKFGFGENIGNRPLLLTSIISLVASIQLLTTGVLAEMISRVFFATSAIPSFVVRDPEQAAPEVGWKLPS